MQPGMGHGSVLQGVLSASDINPDPDRGGGLLA